MKNSSEQSIKAVLEYSDRHFNIDLSDGTINELQKNAKQYLESNERQKEKQKYYADLAKTKSLIEQAEVYWEEEVSILFPVSEYKKENSNWDLDMMVNHLAEYNKQFSKEEILNMLLEQRKNK